jgi:hypothetical protein
VPGGRVSLVAKAKLEWVEVERGVAIPDDTGIIIERHEAAEMARAIYAAAVEAGLLPDSERLAGELQATKRHLADLQKAFEHLLLSKVPQ